MNIRSERSEFDPEKIDIESKDSKEVFSLETKNTLRINPQNPTEKNAQLAAVLSHKEVSINPYMDDSIFEEVAERMSEESTLEIEPGTHLNKIIKVIQKLGEKRCLKLPDSIILDDLIAIAKIFRGNRTLAFKLNGDISWMFNLLNILPYLNPGITLYIEPKDINNVQDSDIQAVLSIASVMKPDITFFMHTSLKLWQKEFENRRALSFQAQSNQVQVYQAQDNLLSTSSSSSSISAAFFLQPNIPPINARRNSGFNRKLWKQKNSFLEQVLAKDRTETASQFNEFVLKMTELKKQEEIFNLCIAPPDKMHESLAMIIAYGWKDIAQRMVSTIPKNKLKELFDTLIRNPANVSFLEKIDALKSDTEKGLVVSNSSSSDVVILEEKPKQKSKRKRDVDLTSKEGLSVSSSARAVLKPTDDYGESKKTAKRKKAASKAGHKNKDETVNINEHNYIPYEPFQGICLSIFQPKNSLQTENIETKQDDILYQSNVDSGDHSLQEWGDIALGIDAVSLEQPSDANSEVTEELDYENTGSILGQGPGFY